LQPAEPEPYTGDADALDGEQLEALAHPKRGDGAGALAAPLLATYGTNGAHLSRLFTATEAARAVGANPRTLRRRLPALAKRGAVVEYRAAVFARLEARAGIRGRGRPADRYRLASADAPAMEAVREIGEAVHARQLDANAKRRAMFAHVQEVADLGLAESPEAAREAIRLRAVGERAWSEPAANHGYTPAASVSAAHLRAATSVHYYRRDHGEPAPTPEIPADIAAAAATVAV